MISSLQQIFRDWVGSFTSRDFSYRRVDSIPSNLAEYVVYIEGKPGDEDLAKLVCPCGCNETITLSLMEDTKNSWRLSFSGWPIKRISLSPSIWRTKGCRSHFFIRRGRVEWCRNQKCD